MDKKKTEILNFRVSKRMKKGFDQYCKLNDKNPGAVLRRFVSKLINLKEQ